MLRQAIEQQRADLALELAHRPALAGGLDLVERACLVAWNPHEHEVVRPRELRREPQLHLQPILRSGDDCGCGRFARQRRADLARGRFARQRRANRRHGRTSGKCEVKLPHLAEVRDAEPLAVGRPQPCRQPSDQLLPIAGPLFTGLFNLDDLTADPPVRMDHRSVDRARDLSPRLLEDLRDPLVQAIIHHALSSSSTSASSSSRLPRSRLPCGVIVSFFRLPSLGLLSGADAAAPWPPRPPRLGPHRGARPRRHAFRRFARRSAS
jgi:hypothetical protein